jgi:hypothetical protein
MKSASDLSDFTNKILEELSQNPQFKILNFNPSEDVKRQLRNITLQNITVRATGYYRAVEQLGNTINTAYKLDQAQILHLGDTLITLKEEEIY